MGIAEDRIEFFGSKRNRMIDQLKNSGGGRMVCRPGGEWIFQSAMPPVGWFVIDVDYTGRISEYVVAA